jgi:hypothetical protein
MLKRLSKDHLWNALTLAIVIGIFGYFASFGSGDFFQNDLEGRGAAYDSMADSFKNLDVTVDPRTITTEAFLVDGKTHMYFGPWPSLLRFFANEMAPSFWGRWSRFSIWIAGVLSVMAILKLLGAALERNSNLKPGERTFWRILGTLGFAFGTPLVFGVSSSSIYHEAILWGLAGALWAMAASGIQSSVFTGIALLSRVTLGIPGCIEKGFSVLQKKKGRIGLALPIAVAVLFQALLNTLRFHSPFVFQDMTKYAGITDHTNSPVIVFGNFNLFRIPDALNAYLGWNGEAFSGQFPFVRMPLPQFWFKERFGYWEPTLSLWVGSTAVLILSILGFRSFMRNQKTPTERALFSGLLIQSGLLFTFISISERYAIDFLPLLVFLVVKGFEQSNVFASKKFRWIMLALMILNGAIMVMSTYAWTGEYWWATPASRAEEVREFLRSF